MHNGDIAVALGNFDPISLDSIDCVALMNRVEIKYLFSSAKITDLIDLLLRKYYVLEINGHRLFQYSTIYFDTPGFMFYNQHLRGELERYKIRYRQYESTQTSFLEIKKRTNKGRIIKRRIENRWQEDSFDSGAVDFISKFSPVGHELIRPVLLNRFTRITFTGFELKERITLDFNISFSDPLNTKKVVMPYLAIVELKRGGYSDYPQFKSIIRELNICPAGFSKYCVGSAVLNENLKSNMIKPKLLRLKKIENEYTLPYRN
jgi:VTC domain